MYDPTKPYKKQILDLIEQTWDTPYVSVRRDVYPVVERKFSYPEVDHTDGIGTKGIYHWQRRTFRNAVLDALAMNLNDLVLVRATPYKLQNHIVLPEDDHEAIEEIVRSLAQECKKRSIAVTGGETSIHNDAQGLDVSITISGFIKNPKPNRFEIGDTLIGIASDGLHSNGFTKMREIFGQEFRPEFISPTLIYADILLPLLPKYEVHGMMHITGGAFTKLKDVISPDADVQIMRNHPFKPQPIFYELHERGVTDEEMYSTFNCGIGFILSASDKNARAIVSEIQNSAVIGEVISGRGKVIIESAFNKKSFEF